jgi:hypothetical protein
MHNGLCILVGHSNRGAIITDAGNDSTTFKFTPGHPASNYLFELQTGSYFLKRQKTVRLS